MSLMEQPYTILAVGTVMTVIFIAGLLKTGKSVFLYLGIAALLATAGTFALERFTITPREQVRATLHMIKHELEQNNLDGVLDYVSDGKPKIKQDAEKYMGMVELQEVDIKSNLAIEIVSQNGLEIAEAKFNCVVQAKPLVSQTMGMALTHDRFPFFFIVRFKLEEDGVWRVRSYELRDARQGMGGTPIGT